MHLKPLVVVVVFGCYGSHHTHKGLKITISGVIKKKERKKIPNWDSRHRLS